MIISQIASAGVLGGHMPAQHLDIQALLVAEGVVEHPLVAAGGGHDLVNRDAVTAPGRGIGNGRSIRHDNFPRKLN